MIWLRTFDINKKYRMKKRLLLLVSLIAVMTYSCKEDETPDNNGNTNNTQPQELCDSLDVTYDAFVKATVDVRCNTQSCHAASAGGFKLGTYEEVKTAAMKENFLGAIKHEQGFTSMPIGSAKLSDEEIQRFECWEKNNFKEK